MDIKENRMNRLIFLLLCLKCLLYTAGAQNLVRNPSFEEYERCPFFVNGWLDWYVKDWDITPSCDYYNSCSPTWSVPANSKGFQYARTGKGYAGAALYSPPWWDEEDKIHENLIGRLSEPLQADSFYRVALFASLADYFPRYACDCIEVLLTADYPPVDSPIVFGRIDAEPQLRGAPLITDSLSWTEVCWVYRAKGGERFLTIGNFRPNTEVTDTMVISWNGFANAYYFFDDVSVEKIPAHLVATGLPTHRTVCPDEVLQDTLHAGGSYDRFLWSTGDTTPSIVITEPGIYTLQAWHGTCLWREELFFEALSEPEVGLGPDTVFCLGGQLTLKVPGSFEQYLWNTGDTLQSIVVDSFGQYYVEASYVCGTLHDTINVFPPPELSVVLPADITIRLGESLQIIPQYTGEVFEWSWYPNEFLDCADCPEPYARPLHDMVYQLEVRDEYGCTSSDSMHIGVINTERLYVPNVFSPDGDGVNDIFTVFGGPELAEISEFLVFDRWGGLVYQAGPHPPDNSFGWDGTQNGQPLPVGIYVWMANVRYLDGKETKLAGEILLVR